MKKVNGFTVKMLGSFWAVSPLAIVIGFGMGPSKLTHSNFKFIEYSPQQTKRVVAYRPLLVADASMGPTTKFNESKVRKLFSLWAEGYDSGKLKPLLPAFAGEEDEEGPRAEIVRLYDSIFYGGHILILNDLKKKNYELALLDYQKFVKIGESFKGSSYLLLASSDDLENSLASNFSTFYPLLNKKEKAIFRSTLLIFNIDGSNLNLITKVDQSNSAVEVEREEKMMAVSSPGENVSYNGLDQRRILANTASTKAMCEKQEGRLRSKVLNLLNFTKNT